MLQRVLLAVMKKVENRRNILDTNTVNLWHPVPSLKVKTFRVPCPRKVNVKASVDRVITV